METIFFPRNDYNVEICAHRLGKSMTYTEQSDAFRGGAESIMEYAATKGLKFGVFWALSTGSDDKELAIPFIENGKMWIDAYCNPEGADTEGTIISEQTYETQRDAIIQRINDWFGIRPIALSYAYGNDSYSDYAILDFLACRNSSRNGGTPYGIGLGNPNNVPYSSENCKSKASTSRWYDDAKGDSSFTTRLQQLSTEVQATKTNGGWYNNFTHWHNVISDGNLQAYKDYMDLLADLNTDDDIYFSGYGEAVAYLVFRQIITKAVMYSPLQNHSTQLVIRLETNNNLGVNADLLQIPVSVKFSTTGTPLEGHTIRCIDRNLISLGNNQYIVEIPYERFPVAIIEIV